MNEIQKQKIKEQFAKYETVPEGYRVEIEKSVLIDNCLISIFYIYDRANQFVTGGMLGKKVTQIQKY